MPSRSTQLHNIVAAGEMSGVLAAAFPSFALDTAALSTRLVHLPEATGAAAAWPAALYRENVAFNWLFLNADDLPAACHLVRRAQCIAPSLVYCHVPGTDAARVAALLGAESLRDGFGIILSCYADADFHAPEMLRVFLREGAMETRGRTGAHDPFYAPARALILSNGAASLSLVQRTFRIGYKRASQLIDAMVGDILARDALTGALCLRST